MTYEARLERLGQRRIGLWDVIAAASRRGSLDQAIRVAEHNQVDHLLRDYPRLAAIAFNGVTAAAAGRRLFSNIPPHLALLDLPSSSAANTKSIAEKSAAWARLREFI